MPLIDPLNRWRSPGVLRASTTYRSTSLIAVCATPTCTRCVPNGRACSTLAFTTSESKRKDAAELGAYEVVISRDAEAMAAHANSFDLIINPVAAPHDLDAFTALLKRDGTLTLVGVSPRRILRLRFST